MIQTLTCPVDRQGMHDITGAIVRIVDSAHVGEGLCTLFIRHTSASLLIQENYDPTAKADLEMWLNRLVPEDDPDFTHRLEGPDDMPAHIKSALTATSLSIPFSDGSLMLGTWQGIFLWEHRHARAHREIVVHLSA